MRLTVTFELSAKSKQELHGLYREIFNRLADPKIRESERKKILHLLYHIKKGLCFRP